MNPLRFFPLALLSAVVSLHAAPVDGWLAWRGPAQNGTSVERGLPTKLDPDKALWTAEFSGASTPVIANGRLYIMGFVGEGSDLQEGVACYDAESGKLLWRRLVNDFLSDIIYNRYATASPAIDPETGNIFVQGTQGLVSAYTPDGKLLWQKSMMELYGRLTFPNGRTQTPVVDGDLVITRGITANWGANGPIGDRFYAFDKSTGELVWASTPAAKPSDSSFSYPYIGWLDGKRVVYATTGDGSVVCFNARTGDPLWRVPLGKAGINATVVVHNNERVVAIYGTPYEPGQMVCFSVPKVKPTADGQPVVVDRSQVELWSLDISTSTSSPILVGDRVYVVAEKGDLCAVNIKTGKIDWTLKIGIEQRNSSPLFADGHLYVPMLDDPASKTSGEAEAGTKGALYVIRPGETKGEILAHIALDGRCFGTPVAYNGKVYMQTTKKIYCWGKAGNNPGVAKAPAEKWPKAGPATQLQIVPSEVLLTPGETASFRVRKLDANGFMVEELKDVSQVKWAGYIPPTAKVKASMNGAFNAKGQLVAAKENVPSAGAYEATLGGLKGYIRGRVLSGFPMLADFESSPVNEVQPEGHPEAGVKFGYPPLPWIGARFKYEVREKDGGKMLVKTIDNKLFQRGVVYLGLPDMKNYTIQADVMTDGNRRKMSEVGLICQRYLIALKGNDQKLEVSSNFDRLRYPSATDAPNFRWSANEWYHLKATVSVAKDGSGLVRAKAWKKGDPEPEAWTVEVPHKNAHQSGSPGLYGFAPQDVPVYIDNIKVTQNN